jgi:hypothetical protein
MTPQTPDEWHDLGSCVWTYTIFPKRVWLPDCMIEWTWIEWLCLLAVLAHIDQGFCDDAG